MKCLISFQNSRWSFKLKFYIELGRCFAVQHFFETSYVLYVES